MTLLGVKDLAALMHKGLERSQYETYFKSIQKNGKYRK